MSLFRSRLWITIALLAGWSVAMMEWAYGTGRAGAGLLSGVGFPGTSAWLAGALWLAGCALILAGGSRLRAAAPASPLVGSEAQLQSILASTLDGVLAVDVAGRVIRANPQMFALWNVPPELAAADDEELLLPWAVKQVREPEAFLRKVRELYGSDAQSCDLLELNDGRVLERVSAPLRVAGQIAGRVWSFREVTERVRAERALHVREARLAATLGAIADLIFVWDSEGRFVEAHIPAGAQVLSPREQFLGKHYGEVLPPTVVAQLKTALAELARTGELQRFDYALRFAERTTWWSASVSRRPAADGAEAGAVGVVREITDRKLAELAIAEGRENYLGLFHTVSEGIFVHGVDGVLIDVNAGAQRMHGFGREDLVGQAAAEFAAPGRNDLGAISRQWAEVFASGRPAAYEFWGRRRNGEEFPEACVTHRGKYFGRDVLITTARDVTESRASAERIREQAALLEVTQEAILVLGLDRVITFFNAGAERLYGLQRREALGRTFESIAYREVPVTYASDWQKFVATGEWSAERCQYSHARGDIIVQVRATIVHSERGPKSVLAVITDLTEAKRLEAQFLRAQRLESLGSLASGIAHDLNNVLTPVLVSAQMLAQSVHSPHERELIQLISDNSRRGADIVHQLLLYGRGSTSPRAPLALGKVVKDLEQIIRETFPKGIELTCRVPEDLAMIDGDRTQIHQVLLNLCLNARDAMPRGGRITLSLENCVADAAFCRRQVEAKPGAYTVIRVRDTGLGIAPAHLEKIFDPFFTTKPAGQGTGLGLASVLGIVRSHGGFITVESREGAGAQFSVYLPARETPAEPAAGGPPRRNLRGGGETILVIDDEDSVRVSLTSVLEHFGYRVVTARDGREGVSAYVEGAATVRLVITDIMMPVMDGIEAIAVLRQIEPGLPIIAMSGVPNHRVDLEATYGPGLRFLGKPFDVEDPLLLVQGLLAASGPRPSP